MSRAKPDSLPEGFQRRVRARLMALPQESTQRKRLSEKWNSKTLSQFQRQNQQAIRSAKRLGSKGAKQLADRYVREMLK